MVNLRFSFFMGVAFGGMFMTIWTGSFFVNDLKHFKDYRYVIDRGVSEMEFRPALATSESGRNLSKGLLVPLHKHVPSVGKDMRTTPSLITKNKTVSDVADTFVKNTSDFVRNLNKGFSVPLHKPVPSVGKDMRTTPSLITKNKTVSDVADTFVKDRTFYNESMHGHHVYNYVYTNSDLCTRNVSGNDSVFLLVICISAPWETTRRTLIRETWGNVTYVLGKHVRIIFLLANTPKEVYNKAIEKENKRYNDICKADFKDKYLNLTLKTMMGFRWVKKFCNQTKFVLKIDSDMVANIPLLVHRLLSLNNASDLTYNEGFLLENTKPVRDPDSFYWKFLVPESIYPHSTYPPYLTGGGYLMSSYLVMQLLSVSDYVPYMTFEDVYIGMLMKTIGVRPQNIRGYTVLRITWGSDSEAFKSLCKFAKSFVMPMNSIQSMYKFWSSWKNFNNSTCAEVFNKTLS